MSLQKRKNVLSSYQAIAIFELLNCYLGDEDMKTAHWTTNKSFAHLLCAVLLAALILLLHIPVAAQDTADPTATALPQEDTLEVEKDCAVFAGLTVCVEIPEQQPEEVCYQIAGGRELDESMIFENSRLVRLEDGSEHKIFSYYLNRCGNEPLTLEDLLWLTEESAESWIESIENRGLWVRPRSTLNARICAPLVGEEELSVCDVFSQVTPDDVLLAFDNITGEVVDGVHYGWWAVLYPGEDGIVRILWLAMWLTERVADETGAPIPTPTPYFIPPEILYDYPDSREVLNQIARTVASVPPCTQRQAAAFVGSEYRETIQRMASLDIALTVGKEFISQGQPEEFVVDYAKSLISGSSATKEEILQSVLDSVVACQEVVNYVSLLFVAREVVLFSELINREYDTLPALSRLVGAIDRLERVSGIYMR